MAIKKYKPTTPGRRHRSDLDFSGLDKVRPLKSLTKKLKYHAGRNSTGKITVRHQGGQHKRLFRVIDFKRNKVDIPAKVATLEYDPNRSAHIALLHYQDGEKRYILAPRGLKKGDVVISSPTAPAKLKKLRADSVPTIKRKIASIPLLISESKLNRCQKDIFLLYFLLLPISCIYV